jgi:GLPGLI family protein
MKIIRNIFISNLTIFNKLNYIPLIILINSFFGYSQSNISTKFQPIFRATYEFNFCPDTTNKKDVVKKKMYLFICDSVSYFFNSEKFVFDSILSNEGTFKGFDPKNPDFIQKSQYLLSTLPKNQDNSIIIKYRNSKKIKSSDLIGLDHFYYYEHSEIFNWKLETGSFMFDSFQCKAANLNFRGRNYKALYSIDLPIMDGPYKFSFLPGLIVHIADALHEVEYKLVALESYPYTVSLITGDQMKKINRQQMRDLKVQFFLNPYIIAESSMKNFKTDDNQKAALLESRKKILEKRGNRIEKE